MPGAKCPARMKRNDPRQFTVTMPLEIIQEIQKRLLEIETYRSHQLYKEAQMRCRELLGFIERTPAVTRKEAFLVKLTKKLEQIDEELKAFFEYPETAKMTPKERELVRKLFTTGKGTKAADAFEEATALLVFGQRTEALKAFKVLLTDVNQRVAAAKSIVRCLLLEGQVQAAVNEYLEWLKTDKLPPKELDSVRVFLQAVLTKKGYRQQLPEPMIIEEIEVEPEPAEEEGDLISIQLPYVTKRFRKNKVLLDVNFQSGNMINCILPKSKENLVGFFRPGSIFHDVRINGTNTAINASIRLVEVSKINEGQQAGSTTITMEVLEGL